MRKLTIISGIALILAIPPWWDYAFYLLLRWYISISAAIVAYGFYKSKLQAWAFIFGSVAFLFNPLIVIHLSKDAWTILDFSSAVLFFLAAYSYKRRG